VVTYGGDVIMSVLSNVRDMREVRDREKVMRGLKRRDTPILKGYQMYHNYLRPHEALDGKTPAEACGIKVEGEDKWLTLIQNASRKPVNRSYRS